jgi:hypothetical protein
VLPVGQAKGPATGEQPSFERCLLLTKAEAPEDGAHRGAPSKADATPHLPLRQAEGPDGGQRGVILAKLLLKQPVQV